MKKITNGLLIVLALFLHTSCTKVDNYEGPNATFQGRIIDKTTGQNFLTETSGLQIKLEELSWSATPSPQYIPSKEDGTFNDGKLFSGHYRVMPTNGAFWPILTPEEIDIKGSTTKDFEITPYLKIKNLTHTLVGTTLTLRFNLEAPVVAGLPKIIDVKPFINTSKYVGNGATISDYTEPNKQDINSNWSDEIAAKTYELRVPNLKTGRTFYARVGVRVDDSFKQFNYSEIVEVPIP